ncbi:MAG: FG-GAP repeat protein [Candidatus Niyogibacteria bacterium]|nr:FG-GAP repeat protein [Candidatus Niyogibacteria bacterium]
MNPNGTVKSTVKISDAENGGPSGLDAGDKFGRSVAAIGDLDGDGITDLAVGADADEASGTDGDGALHILFMNPDGTVKSTVKIADNVNCE